MMLGEGGESDIAAELDFTGVYETPDLSLCAFVTDSPKTPTHSHAKTQVDLVLPPLPAFSVLYTPPPFPTDSDGLSPDPANSNGPSRQSVGLPMDSVGLDQIPLPVRSKSGESPVKSP